MDILGARLRVLRRRVGKTLKEAARDIGISWSTLAMYERGERKPSLDKLRVLAEYYKVAADELLDIAAVEEDSLHRLLNNPNISLAARRMGEMSDRQQRRILRLIELMESEDD